MNTGQTPGFLEPIAFEGTLEIPPGHRIPVQFTASSGVECHLKLTLQPLPLQVVTYLPDDKPGQEATPLRLSALGEAGQRFESDRVYHVRHTLEEQAGSSWLELTLSASVATITLPAENNAAVYNRFYLRGLQSYRNPRLATSLGDLYVAAPWRQPGVDEVSGYLQLSRTVSNDSPEWRRQSERFLDGIQQGLSFATGGELRVALVSYHDGTACELTFYSGSGHKSNLPVISSMDLPSFLPCLVKHLERRGAYESSLWKAVGWLNVHSCYPEVRFLTAMTALETITELLKRKAKAARRVAEARAGMLARLRQVVEEYPDDGEKEKFLRRLPQLFQPSLNERILEVIHRLYLPRGCLSEADIKLIIKRRNDIVHRGQVKPREDIHRAELIVRELLSQIVLSYIGYVGTYQSYVGDCIDRHFAAGAPQPLVTA